MNSDKWRGWVWIGIAAVVIALSGAWRDGACSEEYPIEVTQPITSANGIVLGSVTFVEPVGTPVAGLEVSRTCDASCVSTQNGPANLNVANLARLSVSVLRFGEIPGLFGDTLKVVLDTRSADRDSALAGAGARRILTATVDAIRENAGRGASRWPAAKHVAITILGPAEFQVHGGVFQIAPLPGRHQYE